MSDEKQPRIIQFEDATKDVPLLKDQPAAPDLSPDENMRARTEDFGKDLTALVEKHNHDHQFAATDPDILTEYIIAQIAVFKFATQSRDYRLFTRMAKANAFQQQQIEKP